MRRMRFSVQNFIDGVGNGELIQTLGMARHQNSGDALPKSESVCTNHKVRVVADYNCSEKEQTIDGL